MGKVKSELLSEELGFDDCVKLLHSLTALETPEKLAKRYLENELPPINTVERLEVLQKLMNAIQAQK